MALNYGREKFEMAAIGLAQSEDSLQERLRRAYADYLGGVRRDDIPANSQEDFDYLAEEMSKAKPVGSEGTIAAATAAMSRDDAARIIAKVVSLSQDITAAVAKGVKE